ncbi:TPA: metallophosphoesterase [Kluyvera georgiana]|nr:metallophosphoesterase [Kluyvera georgiana]HED1421116.1 metallophosphoesterase [Kluyvera georgiana]
MKKIFIANIAAFFLCSSVVEAAEHYSYRVAFMPDIHFHDVYGQFQDGAFHGLKNSKSGQNAMIRTMYAQLTSTRLFNENYFALRAALDDAGKKGIKLIALPGDFSDDGQPVHIRGLVKLLEEYQQKYGMRFFATPGNHDPNRPFDLPGGEEDFLGAGGKTQRIFSAGAHECKGYRGKTAVIATGAELPTICSEEMVSSGYEYIMKMMSPFGMNPQPNDIYWETPYSTYDEKSYSYAKAQLASDFHQRQYEICAQGTGGKYRQPGYGPCFTVADSSYLVEPVPGLWLMAVDANVYLPRENADPTKPESANNFAGSGDAGYNKMLTHKQQTVAWMTSVAQRARANNKTLVTFSHFPMVEFDNGAAADLEAIFGKGKFQLARAPKEDTSHALAKTGIGVHVGGHMHFNDTGVRKYPDGSLLFNIQAPSMAAYVPAYKILDFVSRTRIDVQTVILDSVPRFNELFEHYQQEWDHLNMTHSPHLWNKAVLGAKNYYDFTNWHITELTRLRFIPEEWPCDIRQMLFSLNGAEMLILSQISSHSDFQSVLSVPVSDDHAICAKGVTPPVRDVRQQYLKKNAAAWHRAEQKAQSLAQNMGMKLADFSEWNGFDLAVDFYRLRNADELALRDISATRLRQYQLLTRVLAESLPASMPALTANSDFETIYRLRFGSIFTVIDKYLQGNPSRNFHLDLETGEISAR